MSRLKPHKRRDREHEAMLARLWCAPPTTLPGMGRKSRLVESHRQRRIRAKLRTLRGGKKIRRRDVIAMAKAFFPKMLREMTGCYPSACAQLAFEKLDTPGED